MRNSFPALPKKGKKTLSKHATAEYYHFIVTCIDVGFAFKVYVGLLQASVSTASRETLCLCATSKTWTKPAEKGLLLTGILIRRHKTGTMNKLSYRAVRTDIQLLRPNLCHQSTPQYTRHVPNGQYRNTPLSEQVYVLVCIQENNARK